MTASHYSAMYNRFDALNLLIEHGAHLRTFCKEHYTVFDHVVRTDHQQLLEALWPHAKRYQRDKTDVSEKEEREVAFDFEIDL